MLQARRSTGPVSGRLHFLSTSCRHQQLITHSKGLTVVSQFTAFRQSNMAGAGVSPQCVVTRSSACVTDSPRWLVFLAAGQLRASLPH